MSVQLIIYPQFFDGQSPLNNYQLEYVVDGVSFLTIDGSDSYTATQSNAILDALTNAPPAIANSWYRFRSSDAGTPSFNPMDYDKGQLKFTNEAPVPAYKGSETKPSTDTKTDTPTPPKPPTPPDIQCPTQDQLSKEPVGFLFDSGRKEVLGYKLVGDQCIREVGDVPIVTQVLNGLPPVEVVITTGGIAVVATTSALLAKPFADILLKVIKPTVKKVLKKVAAIRGKKPKVESVTERRAEQRLRNEAIAKLRSVAAKSQKKKK